MVEELLAETADALSPLLNQAFYFTRRTFDEAVRHFGLTAAQMGVLRRIVEDPGITGAEISRRMFTTPQAAQLMLTTLEGKGLIERKPDPASGRIVRSFITIEGRRVITAALQEALKIEQELGSVLSREERATLVRLLRRYVHQPRSDQTEGDAP